MLIFKDKSISKMLIKASILLIFFLLAFKGILYFSEKTIINYHAENPEVILNKIPLYQLLAKYEPETYEKIKADISNSLKNGEKLHILRNKIQAYMNIMIAQRIPYTSNEAMVNYMATTLKEMEALRNQGYGLCYDYLYPNQSKPLDITQYVDKSILKEDLHTLTAVVKASYENPQLKPNPIVVGRYINQVYRSMFNIYGQQQVAILLDPQNGHVHKDKMCDMTINLFNEILKLPVEQSGETLRYIVMQNGAAQN